MSAAAFLADTNVLIDLAAGDITMLRDRVEEQTVGSIVTSAICVAEAMFGARANGQEAALSALLKVIEPRSFDLAASEAYRTVPFGRGRLDRLIAAHALALGLIVVTNNVNDFADVPGLGVENWSQ